MRGALRPLGTARARGVCGAVSVNHEKNLVKEPRGGRAALGRKLMVYVEIREKGRGGKRQGRRREMG